MEMTFFDRLRAARPFPNDAQASYEACVDGEPTWLPGGYDALDAEVVLNLCLVAAKNQRWLKLVVEGEGCDAADAERFSQRLNDLSRALEKRKGPTDPLFICSASQEPVVAGRALQLISLFLYDPREYEDDGMSVALLAATMARRGVYIPELHGDEDAPEGAVRRH